MFVHSWPAFLTKIPIFGILVNILVTKILKVLTKRLIFSIKNPFGENIDLVDFHRNRLIGIVAGSHNINRFLWML